MRQLGMALRRLRDAAGKSQREVAYYLDVTDTALSKMEHGTLRVKVPFVRSLCQLYDVDPTLGAFLEQLARESGQLGWWASYGDTVPDWFRDYLGMETDAAEAWTYESEPIPGLLQIEEYASVVVKAAASAELRATRQRRLTDDKPLVLRAVLNESVLRRAVGGPDVMRKQIRHVIDMAQLPNITIQVLPFAVGFHPAMAGSFTALRFPEIPMMDTVYVEGDNGATYAEKPRDVERYTAIFERLTQLALDQAGTKSFLEQMERRYSE